uniref:Uncharacterized protein n=1 Tax=Arundo donax TaxID=35708 RepID=A0A0A9BJB1_ARUDO
MAAVLVLLSNSGFLLNSSCFVVG